jgi:hypothetical protein
LCGRRRRRRRAIAAVATAHQVLALAPGGFAHGSSGGETLCE